MRFLLDTYALVLVLTTPNRLHPDALAVLGDPGHTVYFSAGNIWEIEIKVKLGKLPRPVPDLIVAARSQGYVELPISAVHAAAAGRLPLHHRDPFDRLFIAQAQLEGLIIVTPDRTFDRYAVHTLAC